MRVAAWAAAIAGFCLIGAALADEASPPDTAGGRYTFNKVADGWLRLDTQSGEVSLCSQRKVGWACQKSPDDRAVLESEIARGAPKTPRSKKTFFRAACRCRRAPLRSRPPQARTM